MNKFDLGKGVHINPLDYATQGNAILGIIKSGKSYTATYIAERLMDAGIPIVAFDPIGVWRWLKVGAKKKSDGYKVVVIGDEADLPLDKAAIVEVVRAAMRDNISLVIDLYSMKLSKADWRSIVQSCIRVLLYENKQYGVRHIFLEEAAEFVPQRPQPEQGAVYAEMEKLARMGGNASLGFTLINQRAEEVNKAVLELCECIITHRQRGRNSLNALGKWLEYADTSSKDILASVPHLEQGECWVWMDEKITRTHVYAKRTVHPDRRKSARSAAQSKGVNVSAFIKQITKTVKVQADEIDNIAALKTRIKILERAGKKAPAQVAPKGNAVGDLQGVERRMRIEFEHFLQERQKEIDTLWVGVESFLRGYLGQKNVIENLLKRRPIVTKKWKAVPAPSIALSIGTSSAGTMFQPEKERDAARHRKEGAFKMTQTERNRTRIDVKKEGTYPNEDDAPQLGRCERGILGFLVANPERTWSKEQVGIMSGYSSGSGGFNNALARLNTLGFIRREGTNITAGESVPSPVLAVLGEMKFSVDEIRKKLGKCEREIFDVVQAMVEQGIADTTKETLADNTVSKYQPGSGGFGNALARLHTLGIITRAGGKIKPSDDFKELLERE